MTDGIVDLRQECASDRLSLELLASVNLTDRTDTITRFFAEVADKSQQRRTPNRRGRRATPPAAKSPAANSALTLRKGAVENQPLSG